jgi:hypothetical protein
MAKKKEPVKKVKDEHVTYRVLIDFKDLCDGEYLYREGDVYPREGSMPTKDRIEYLKGNENKFKQPVID